MSHQYTRIYYDASNVIIATETQDTPFFHATMVIDPPADRIESCEIDAVELTERQVLDRYEAAGYSPPRAVARLDELKVMSAANGGAEVEPAESGAPTLTNIRVSVNRTTFFAREFRHAVELQRDLEFDPATRVRFKTTATRPTPIANARDAEDPKRPGDTPEPEA